jgi:hypothetical protein
MRSGRNRAVVLITVVVLAAAALAVRSGLGRHRTTPGCVAAIGPASYRLDLEQAANATTVAAVGKRIGLPDHAVTIALAAALQESGLHNLAHGDRDSLGLFQQRPSQGWGTPDQIMVPRYAASAFYDRLVHVDSWLTLSVTDAAQQVQRSGAPDAYAQWEREARGLAQVLTGEVAAGLTCRFDPGGGSLAPAFSLALAQEVGSPSVGTAVPAARGWTVGSWIVGHAQLYHVSSVAFGGQRWTASNGVWKPDPSVDSRVQILPTQTNAAVSP